MKNKWVIAFWSLFVVFVFTTLLLLYTIVDQGVTITYMQEGYQDTESDLEQLSQVIKGKLSFEDFHEITARYEGLKDSSYVGLNRIKIEFGEDKKVSSVTTIW